MDVSARIRVLPILLPKYNHKIDILCFPLRKVAWLMLALHEVDEDHPFRVVVHMIGPMDSARKAVLLGNGNVTTVFIKGPGDLREPGMRRRGVDAASISDASYSTGGFRRPMSIAVLIFSKLNVYGLKPQLPLQLQKM